VLGAESLRSATCQATMRIMAFITQKRKLYGTDLPDAVLKKLYCDRCTFAATHNLGTEYDGSGW